MAAGHFLSKTIRAIEYKLTGEVDDDKKPYILTALETGSPKKFMSLTAYPNNALANSKKTWTCEVGNALILAPFKFNTKILKINIFSQNNIQSAKAKIGLYKMDKTSLTFTEIPCINQAAFFVTPNNSWVELACKELLNVYSLREMIKKPVGYGTAAGDIDKDNEYDANMVLSQYYLALVCETVETTKANDTLYKVKIEFTDTGSVSTSSSKHIL